MDCAWFVVAGIAIAWVLWALVVRSRAAQPQRSDPERALDDATAKLSARLDALMEPRPERARVALDVDGFPSIDGTLEVPPRARVFHRGADVLAGRMLALRQESHPTDGTRIFQLEAPYQAEAVVHDASGALVWAPEGACDLVFRADGTEVVEVGSIHEERPAEHRAGSLRIESPLQSEFTWTPIARCSGWPRARGPRVHRGSAHERVVATRARARAARWLGRRPRPERAAPPARSALRR